MIDNLSIWQAIIDAIELDFAQLAQQGGGYGGSSGGYGAASAGAGYGGGAGGASQGGYGSSALAAAYELAF